MRKVSMQEDEVYIPLILRLKILRENKKYFFFIVFLNIFIWVSAGIKANVFDSLIKDPGLYFHIPAMVFAVWAANRIVEYYIKIFNIDIYNSNIINRESAEFNKIKSIFSKNITYQQKQLLESICNKNEKLFVLFGTFIVISATIINDFILTKNFGTHFNVYVYPWTFIGSFVNNYLYWALFITPLAFSLLWVFVGIVKGIRLIMNTPDLKLKSWKEAGKEGYNTIPLREFSYNLQPILDLLYMMSYLTIILAIIYTIAVVSMNMIYPNYLLYFFSFLVVCIGLTFFVWPQQSVHMLLKNNKENTLLWYYNLYEGEKNKFLTTLKKPTNGMISNNALKENLSLLKDLIAETEKFDTWPNFSRIYKLIGAVLGSIIVTFMQIFANKII